MRTLRTRELLAMVVLAGSVAGAVTTSSDVATAAPQPQSMTFDQPGAQRFTVPPGVTTVHLHVVGGSGAPGSRACFVQVCSVGGAGGPGGMVDMDVAVRPGEVIQMVVGGAGSASAGGLGSAAGGLAGRDSRPPDGVLLLPGKGNGGGATSVARADGTMLAVGGGGGGGGGAAGKATGDGGDGGAGIDGRGFAGHGDIVGAGGRGSSGSNTGGAGGNAVSDRSAGGGGGGGGGYQPNGTGGGAGGSSGDFGVVGGAGGGGAGGHSFSAASDAVIVAAPTTGNGQVVITWTPPTVDERSVTTGLLSSSANPSYLGEPVTFTVNLPFANYSGPGTVTFGTYDPTTGVELPQATWDVGFEWVDSRQYTWSTVFPTGFSQVWVSYSGDPFNKPWKSPYLTQLVGLARPRTVLVEPSSTIDFGTQAVGSTTKQTVTIDNISAAPWKVSNVSSTAASFAWSGGTCSTASTTPLAMGSTCTIELSFTPTAAGPAGGAITLLDEVGNPTVLNVTGAGLAPTVPPVGPPPAPGRPTVTSISPSSGSKRGGTLVTITGTNLVNVTSITFGSRSGTQVTCASATTCTVRSPKGDDTVDVRVTTPAGRSSTSRADRFRYTR